MAAPAVTARVIPTGRYIPDGFQTTIAFAKQPAIAFWEQSIKPGGDDGGEAIRTTNMLSQGWRTSRARKLKELMPISGSALIDPDAVPLLRSMVNDEQAITVHFPNGGTSSFFGFLQKYEHTEHKEGELPMISFTIVPTNWDPVNNVEAAPLYVPAAGT